MNQRELEKEGTDLKLLLILLSKKISYVILSTLIGAALFGGIYFGWYQHSEAARRYQADSKYYLVFDEIVDKTYFDYYYNGYTWNELVQSDPIMDICFEELAVTNYTEEEIRDAIEATILSDVRVLTTTVRMDTAEKTKIVQQALEKAVVAYAEKGEYLQSVTLIRSVEPYLPATGNHVLRAALTGAGIALFLSILVFLLYLTIRDAIYLPWQFERRYRIINAGIRIRSGQQSAAPDLNAQCQESLQKNLHYLTKGESYPVVTTDNSVESLDYEAYRTAGGVIVEYAQGANDARRLTALLENLRRQDCKVVCAIMTEADASILSMYYGRKKL